MRTPRELVSCPAHLGKLLENPGAKAAEEDRPPGMKVWGNPENTQSPGAMAAAREPGSQMLSWLDYIDLESQA